MKLLCLDLETTGLPTHEVTHAVVEVGYTTLHADEQSPWSIGDTVSMVTNPHRQIPVEAMGVHWITDQMAGEGMDASTAFMGVVAHKPDYYVAHNASMEQAFFKGGDTPWLCTYKIALRFWPDAPNHQQSTLLFYLGLDFDRIRAFPPHRAGPDSYVCALLMKAIMEDPRDVELETLVRWSKGPALLPRCTIGKHRGKPWAEVDTGFLQWVLKKSKEEAGSFDRDIVANVRHHLKQRGAL